MGNRRHLTKDQIQQLAEGLAAACPGIYVEAIKDPEKAYEMGKVMGHTIAGIVQGITDAIEGFYDGFVEGAEEEEPELKTSIKDCENCWCWSCMNYTNCPEKPAGYNDKEIPFPCVSCKDEMRHLEKGSLPCPCEAYKGTEG